MAIPLAQEIKWPMLLNMRDGNFHSAREMYDVIAHCFQVALHERQVLQPGGWDSLFDDRVRGAQQLLKADGLITWRGTNKWRITPGGAELVGEMDKAVHDLFIQLSSENGCPLVSDYQVKGHVVDYYCPTSGAVVLIDGIGKQLPSEDRLRYKHFESGSSKLIHLYVYQLLKDPLETTVSTIVAELC